MAKALVLNASYEPLCAVSGRRALLLTLNSKAEALHLTDDVFHSEKYSFAVPSVVRLLHYVKVPFHAGTSVSRRGVFVRDGGKCQYCNGPADSIDHVIPRSKGGSHTWENVVAACRSCNGKKRDRLLEETSFKLKRVPFMPRERVWVLAQLAQANPDWMPYLRTSRSAETHSLTA